MAEDDFHHQSIPVLGATLHTVTAGDPAQESSILFLHGWPQDWSAMGGLMQRAQGSYRVAAIDLPGVGRSTTALSSGAKSALAPYVLAAVDALGLRNPVVVGHDVGGMIAYACLRARPRAFRAAVIVSVVIPGLEPWDQVLRNPHLWHFAFHEVPDLPELLVQGKERDYFAFFYDTISAHPERIQPAARERYAAAYASRSALKSGFGWYRGLAQDARDNSAAAAKEPVEIPVLYLRGAKDSGYISRYAAGLRDAGVRNVQAQLVPDSGHFAPEEQPDSLWQRIAAFLR
jgi:pimeloyl-ACP methyl ester carboxylesterase